MKVEDFKPGTAENSYCSFNASFLLQPDGSLKTLAKTQGCCSTPEQIPVGDPQRAREFVARQWSSAPEPKDVIPRHAVPSSIDEFLERKAQYTLSISGMAFQDVWNLDLTRLKECYIHVASADKRMIPFCAYKTLIWNGPPDYEAWGMEKLPSPPVNCLTEVNKGCPYDCGLCPEHRQSTCCVVLEITNSCNLLCPVCFASAQEKDTAPAPSLEEIGAWYDNLLKCGGPLTSNYPVASPRCAMILRTSSGWARKKVSLSFSSTPMDCAWQKSRPM